MSIQAFRWATRQEGLTSPEKFVLVMIGDYYNQEWHRAWPSHATLATDTGLSIATVKRSIKVLEQRGLVLVEPWLLNDGGAWMSNRYLLPAYDRRSQLASELPVLVFAGESDFSDADYQRLPNSNLFIEVDALTR